MSGALTSKINQILKLWPRGTVALSSWLESQGVYQQLAHKYEQTQWFERVGYGAFVRSGDKVDWQGALYAIQTHASLPIHAAAKTALELHGITHFVAAGRRNLFLFGAPRAALPSWFKKKDWGVTIRYATPELFSGPHDQGITEKTYGDFSIRVSSLERAILELLYLVPAQQQYEESKQLFEGLRALRPSLVQSLLENCKSIKVKRLFLHLAEATGQSWFEDLKIAKIDLGKGKRVIAEGGHFDSKYNISVPKIHEGGTLEAEEGP
jgi:hypothetical protein